VDLLLRACDRRRDVGRPDYAAILLVMRLEMRASEVATLTLDDIDWRAGVLTVRAKAVGWIGSRCRSTLARP
jgi:integrase/recombinase XerD